MILEVAAPFIGRAETEGWIDGSFFIRFRDTGPHVRLRVHTVGDGLDAVVREAFVAHARTIWPEVTVGDAPPVATGRQPGEVLSIRWLPYIAEEERYGGRAGVSVAERVFAASSRAACGLLRKIDPALRDSRLGKALLAMLVLIHAVAPDAAAAAGFADVYSSANLRIFAREEGASVHWSGAFDAAYARQAETLGEYVIETWTRLLTRDPVIPELDRYREDLADPVDALLALAATGSLRQYGGRVTAPGEVLRRIVPSYVHMMNNRLGVTIQEEAYLAYLIRRALSAPRLASVSER